MRYLLRKWVVMVNKFFIVFRHTFITKLKSKAFFWTTLLISAAILLLVNIQTIIQFFEEDETSRIIEVYDPSEQVLPLLSQQLDVMYPGEFTLKPLSLNDQEKSKTLEEADRTGTQRVKDEVIDGYMLIEEQVGSMQAYYKDDGTTPGDHVNSLQQALNAVQFQLSTAELNLTPEQAAVLFEPMPFEFVSVADNAMTKEEYIQSFFLVYILLFAIYFSVLMYGQMVAMEVAAEKTSRVMEILISSVSPVKQLFAKILGIATLGIFQVAIFVAVGVTAIKVSGQDFELGNLQFSFADIKISLIIYALIFYVLGYLLYATLLAMVGSLVSRTEDTAQLMTPITMLFVAGFIVAMYGLQSPESTIVQVMSYIPFFSPMLMFLRIGMGAPTSVEVIISIVLLILSIILFAWIGGKVYRGGVLMYGKRPSLKDIGRAMKLR